MLTRLGALSAAVVFALATAGMTRVAATPVVTFFTTDPAQPSAQCDLVAPLFSCADWVEPASGWLAGWSLDTATGHTAQSVQLWKTQGDGVGKIAEASIVVSRPDVAAAFGTSDPNVGWGLNAGHPLTAGDYALLVTDFPYAQSCVAVNGTVQCAEVANQIRFTVGQ